MDEGGKVNVFYFSFECLIFIALAAWGAMFVFSPIPDGFASRSFMHMVNLPFHEAGHILFSLAGEFMGMLGGSLMQLLVPLVCALAFLFQSKDKFGASVGAWWLGESLIDLAPYINDARDLRMLLLGGVTGRDVEDYHDWEYILRKLSMLPYDHIIARATHLTGGLIIFTALVWGGWTLWQQSRRLDW